MFILNVLFSVCFVGCAQTGKHFCSRQQADGMPPPGRQLAERCQHKLAFVHPWMRQDDSGGVDNLIAGIHDVDVKLTVGITAVGIAVLELPASRSMRWKMSSRRPTGKSLSNSTAILKKGLSD